VLQQGAADKAAQYSAQGKAKERINAHWAVGRRLRPTSPSAHEGKLIHHKGIACLKVLLARRKEHIISVNLLNYGYLFYRRNVKR
jgi:hypothetical protein